MSPRRRLAEVIQEKSFSQELDIYSANHQRMPDIHAAIDWRLAHDPLKATKVADDHYVFKTTSVGNSPSFWVLYSYDEVAHRVHLLSIGEVKE